MDKLEILIDVSNDNTQQINQIRKNLMTTIKTQLKTFDIDCTPEVSMAKLSVPKDKSKYKRFERKFDAL